MGYVVYVFSIIRVNKCLIFVNMNGYTEHINGIDPALILRAHIGNVPAPRGLCC